MLPSFLGVLGFTGRLVLSVLENPCLSSTLICLCISVLWSALHLGQDRKCSWVLCDQKSSKPHVTNLDDFLGLVIFLRRMLLLSLFLVMRWSFSTASRIVQFTGTVIMDGGLEWPARKTDARDSPNPPSAKNKSTSHVSTLESTAHSTHEHSVVTHHKHSVASRARVSHECPSRCV